MCVTNNIYYIYSITCDYNNITIFKLDIKLHKLDAGNRYNKSSSDT